MPSPKELAKALAYRGEIRNTPQNSFLGGVANFLAPVSEFADRDKLPGSIPLLGGMSFADLSGLKGAQSLVNDMSYGKSPISGASLQTTKVDPRVLDLAGVSGAMIPVGKALGKAALREGARQIETGTGVLGRNVIDPRQQIITYHGSPHTFPPTANNPLGEFDPMKVGTGEGAQAYGVGAGYLAEAKDLAKRYQENLSKGPEKFFVGGKEVFSRESGGQPFDISDPKTAAIFTAARDGEKAARKSFKNQGAWGNKAIAELDLMKGQQITREAPGNLYKVDLPDEHVAKMLDWDKPMTESEMTSIYDKMQQGPLNSFAKPFQENFYSRMERGSPATDGQDLFMELSKELGGQKYASDALQNMGITGIRYLDAASRDAGKGTSNFVVFDPKHMNILERNGVGGAMMQRPKTEFEILHDTAQRNAALPKEQGGLGLPEGNTGMDRAAAMDWNTPAYHGSGEELRVINNEKLKRNAYGKGLHSASDPELANIFANHSSQGQNVSPLLLRVGNQASKEDYKNAMNQVWDEGGHDATKIRQLLIDKGFDTVTYNHGDFHYPQGAGLVKSLPNQDLSYATLNPSQVRSRFAAFDPMRRHEADILAGVGVGGMLDPQAIAEALRQQDRK